MERQFRWAVKSDYSTLADVMFDAVRNGPSRYTEQQRSVWVPAPRKGHEWTERLAAQDIILAEEGGEALGFMSLADKGYVDFAYIRPAARGTGLFRQMLRRIEDRAKANGVQLLWVHASLNAQPAFAAAGFVVRRREEVLIGEVSFERFEMEKTLRAVE